MEADPARSRLDQQDVLKGWTNFGLSIGGVSLRIACERNVGAMLCTSLQPFQATAECFDVEITVKSVRELAKVSSQQLFDSERTWSLCQSGEGFVFDFSDASFGEHPYKRLLVNAQFTSGTLQINQKAFRPYAHRLSPLDYPLDELLIMHRLTQEKAIELHGTGIVRPNGEANLFVGHSGAGKSTTTRLWTATEDVEVLSDDRIIVRRDLSTPTRIRMYGTPWHGEAMFASPNSSPLTRIFVLEHGHGNVITPLSPSQAVAELFARSFVPFHRHEYVDSALVFLEELVDAVPVYRYAFEPDQRAVDKILHFHD
jgi:hypothetical protein